MKSFVVFDIDGVLADFEGDLVSKLVDTFGISGKANRHFYEMEDRFYGRNDILDTAEYFMDYPPFYRSIEPIYSAIQFAKDLMQSGLGVMYLTSRPRGTEAFTRMWLQKHTWNYSGSMGVFFAENKADFLADIDVEFVVEDSPAHIQALKNAGKSVFCWSQPWNEGIFPRLFTERQSDTIFLWSNSRDEAEPFWMAMAEQETI